jgi:putative N6-adenine-specific DNA methylase
VDWDQRKLVRITCAPGVSPYLAREVAALGYTVDHEDATGVEVHGSLWDCARLNWNLRTALNVLWLVKRFRCPSPDALYREIASQPWETMIDRDEYLCVTSDVDHPKINNTMFANQKVKDAVVDRILKHTGGRPDAGPDRDCVVLYLYWKQDRAWLYVNTSGRKLADRGYRLNPHSAPMQEALAAAVLMACGYDGTQPLVNPMCGSGTIAIEAALMACHIIPGFMRSNYSQMHLLGFDRAQWKKRFEEQLEDERDEPPHPICASDHDKRAVRATIDNAKKAGVRDLMAVDRVDFSDQPMPKQPGIILMNPEYGLRLGDEEQLVDTYRGIGDFFKQRCPGWTGAIFTGNRNLAKSVGLKTAQRIAFFTADVECRLLLYDLFAGTRAEHVAGSPGEKAAPSA